MTTKTTEQNTARRFEGTCWRCQPADRDLGFVGLDDEIVTYDGGSTWRHTRRPADGHRAFPVGVMVEF